MSGPLDPDFDGGWSLADHASKIIEDIAWERRKAEECERAQAQIRKGLAVDYRAQYERMRAKRRLGGQATKDRARG